MTPETTTLQPGDSLISLKLKIESPRRVRIFIQAHSYEIDWGDGKISSVQIHDYTRLGEYQVQIRGQDILKLKFVSCDCIEANICNCSELTAIDCRSNPLQNLILIGCDNLKELNCSHCKLKELNFLEATFLGWINCSDNVLQKIKLSGLSELVVLDASNNKLKKFRLDGCCKLASLDISNNQLSPEELNRVFSSLVSQPPQSNAYINYKQNPGSRFCNSWVFQEKNWKAGLITDPINSDISEEIKSKPARKLIVINDTAAESLIRLTFAVEKKTDITIHASAKNILYVWGPTDVTMGNTGLCCFIPLSKKENKEVYIFANQLETLSIENTPCKEINIQSPTLKALNINNTLITKLNLSCLPLLQCIECSGTLLNHLDLSVCRQLNMATCQENRLKTLNVEGLANMQFLDCCGNRLTQLRLRGCTHLRTLNAVKNKIEELSIEECYELRYLHCDHNRLANLDDVFRQLPEGNNFLLVGENKPMAGAITFSHNPGESSADLDILQKKKWIDTRKRNE